MAAFIRMFMDLVGIFNEDQTLTEDGVSFGMMFGARPGPEGTFCLIYNLLCIPSHGYSLVLFSLLI